MHIILRENMYCQLMGCEWEFQMKLSNYIQWREKEKEWNRLWIHFLINYVVNKYYFCDFNRIAVWIHFFKKSL